MENDFLKHLSSSQVREIVDYMERKTVAAGTHIIREGDTGESGSCQLGPNIIKPFYHY